MKMNASRFLSVLALGALGLWPILSGAQCPIVPIYPDVTKPTVNMVSVGSTAVTGTVKTGDAGTVQLCVNNAAQGSPQAVNADGTFSIAVPALTSGQKVRVQFTSTSGGASHTGPASEEITVAAAGSSGAASSLYTLGLVGINATGSSGSGPSQQYFASFDIISPLAFLPKGACGESDQPLAQKCWIWMNPRVASVPTASSTTISSLSSPTSVSSGISGQNIGQITQSFEFHGGIEYLFRSPNKGTRFGWTGSWARTTVGLILGGGSVTPFSPTGSAKEFGLNANLAQQFAQIPALVTELPQLAGALCSYGLTSTSTFTCPPTPMTKPTTVAFLFPNRSRFYRDYFAGFRIRTFYFTGDCPGTGCKTESIYPGTFDLRLGQDETVTGGHLRGVVLTLNGTYPVPGTKGTVRIFGSSYLRTHKNHDSPTLVLIPSSKFVALDDPTVAIQQIQPSDQDYFRLGIGVDLIPLLAKLGTQK